MAQHLCVAFMVCVSVVGSGLGGVQRALWITLPASVRAVAPINCGRDACWRTRAEGAESEVQSVAVEMLNVSGTIRWTGGALPAGVLWTCAPSGGSISRELRPNARGEFQLRVPRGLWAVRATSAGGLTWSVAHRVERLSGNAERWTVDCDGCAEGVRIVRVDVSAHGAGSVEDSVLLAAAARHVDVTRVIGAVRPGHSARVAVDVSGGVVIVWRHGYRFRMIPAEDLGPGEAVRVALEKALAVWVECTVTTQSGVSAEEIDVSVSLVGERGDYVESRVTNWASSGRWSEFGGRSWVGIPGIVRSLAGVRCRNGSKVRLWVDEPGQYYVSACGVRAHGGVWGWDSEKIVVERGSAPTFKVRIVETRTR